jgi:Tol biopolymer transport system component
MPGAFISGWAISPDSNFVSYQADQDTIGTRELYLAPIFGGTIHKVNGPLVAGGNVDFWSQFNPDSNRILYIADQNVDELQELFVAQLNNGVPDPPAKLNGTLVAGGDVRFALFSPDSNRVIYEADQITDEVTEIFSVPSAGGLPAIKLNGPLVPGGSVTGFQLNGSSSYVLYFADQQTDEVFELFVVPIAGGPSLKLNGALVPGGNVTFGAFTPDNTRVIYTADQAVDERVELYSVPSAGGAAVRLNGNLPVGGNVEPVFLSETHVLYVADQVLDEKQELFIVPIAGGTAVKLNGAMGNNQDVATFSGRLSPDGRRVIYRADQDIDDVNELYSVPSTGGASVKLNGALVAGGDVRGFDLSGDFFADAEFSPDGSRVMYIADQEVDQQFEIFLVPSAGGTPVKVNGPLFAGTSVSPFPVFTADGNRIVFMARHEHDQTAEVYARVIRLSSAMGGGPWEDSRSWNLPANPDELMQVILDSPGTISASGAFTRRVNELRIGGGARSSTLTLSDSATISAINGVTILPRGIIQGDGQIVATIPAPSQGELRATAGEQLRISSPTFTNSGLISALGSASDAAEIELDSIVVNSAMSGLITGQNSVLRASSGMTNQGSILFSGGANSMFGDINNAGGRVVVAGGASTTFYDDMIQNGTLQVIKVGSHNSTAVFAGAFTGSGGSSGGGDIFFLGDLRPGNSPATIMFDNNIALGASAVVDIEIAGSELGQFDKIRVTGALVLNGTLEVTLIDGFMPQAGDSFDILDWTTLAGSFASLDLPLLGSGLSWNTSQIYTSGILAITRAVAVEGDFNLDGAVDAADYVVWRKRNGSPQEYDIWRTNFGRTAGAGSGSADHAAGSASSPSHSSVPEPFSYSLALVAMIAVLGGRPARLSHD